MSTVSCEEAADVFGWDYWDGAVAAKPNKDATKAAAITGMVNEEFNSDIATMEDIAAKKRSFDVLLQEGRVFSVHDDIFTIGAMVRFELERLTAVRLPIPEKALESLSAIRKLQTVAEKTLLESRSTSANLIAVRQSPQRFGNDSIAEREIWRCAYDDIEGVATYLKVFSRHSFYGIEEKTRTSLPTRPDEPVHKYIDRQYLPLALPSCNPTIIGQPSYFEKVKKDVSVFTLERINRVEVYNPEK